MPNLQDTIIAPATPPGIGAIHLIRLSGSEAIPLVARYWKGTDLQKCESHSLHYGRILDEEGQIIDEVVLGLYSNPRSYTGEDIVEISCHGSPYIVDRILRLLVQAGARPAEPGEFSMRAFLNGKMDLSQTEAVADLIAGQSAAAHRLAMNQLRGGVSDAIGQLREQLIEFASLIELELDFGEEDVEFADRTKLHELVAAIRGRIRELSDSFSLGNALKNGIPTVIAGRPNAGKSTLLNSLLQEERAIVSAMAGTTRDTIEEVVHIQGVAFRLIDTAGLRETTDEVEAIGVARSLAKLRTARLLIYVFDVIDTAPDELHRQLNAIYQPDTELLVVANKMDLNPYTTFEQYFGLQATNDFGKEKDLPADYQRLDFRWSDPEAADGYLLHADRWVPLVARDGANLDLLRERIYHLGVGRDWQEQDLILTNARHLAALQAADRDLQAVELGLQTGITSDFIAMDIRAALRHLGEIAGTVSSDDLLSNIFSNFCIGK